MSSVSANPKMSLYSVGYVKQASISSLIVHRVQVDSSNMWKFIKFELTELQ